VKGALALYGPWSTAFDNYCAYVPQAIERWGVIFDRRFHDSIIKGLLERIDCAVLLDVADDPQSLSRFSERNIDDDRVGVLGFLVNQPAFDAGYSTDQSDALAQFNKWRLSRVKICFEVWDANFCTLFAECSHDLRARCLAMLDRVSTQARLHFYLAGSHRNDFYMGCEGAVWRADTGFDDDDYMLPSGEVGTCPSSVEGILSPTGWIIGTVPFGSKYGFVSAGDIVLEFSGGRIVHVSGNNVRLCADFEAVLSKVPALSNVSEVAVGMSRAVQAAAKTLSTGHLWHERHFGFHVGLGARLPQTPHPTIKSVGHHLDIVFMHGTLRDASSAEILAW
jgi:hypothetical protein